MNYSALIEKLDSKTDAELFAEIGRHTSADIAHISEDTGQRGLGPGESPDNLGYSIFSRINKELHQLCCGSSDADKTDRQKILSAIRMDRTTAAATISAVLISNFAVNVPVAAALSILLLRIVLIPAGEEICKYWSKIISAT